MLFLSGNLIEVSLGGSYGTASCVSEFSKEPAITTLVCHSPDIVSKNIRSYVTIPVGGAKQAGSKLVFPGFVFMTQLRGLHLKP